MANLVAGSLFAGIGGFDEAFRRAGIHVKYAAECDTKCNSVRRRHFPNERTIDDVAAVCGPEFRADIIAAGWPCQGNSVAGRRAGMADKRSGLWREVYRVLAEQRPRWFLGENVPGILSVNRGREWLAVLRDLAELGYGFAYRVLDAQWFGVPQRRRRVFLVGCLGDWRRAAQVLFESESLPWNSAPSRETRASVAGTIDAGSGIRRGGGQNPGMLIKVAYATAPCIGASGRGFSRAGESRGQDPVVACFGGGNQSGEIEVATTTTTTKVRFDFDQETLIAFDSKQSGEGGDAAPTLRALSHKNSHANAGTHVAVAYQCHGSNVGPMGTVRSGNGAATGGVPFTFQTRCSRNDRGMPSDTVPALTSCECGSHADTKPHIAGGGMAVRRLTPRECERLQGFPDDWTRYGEHGEEIADGPRYRMLGNAVAVPVVEWIARRIVALAEND